MPAGWPLDNTVVFIAKRGPHQDAVNGGESLPEQAMRVAAFDEEGKVCVWGVGVAAGYFRYTPVGILYCH